MSSSGLIKTTVNVVAGLVAVIPIALTMDGSNKLAPEAMRRLRGILASPMGLLFMLGGTALSATRDIKVSIIIAGIVYTYLEWIRREQETTTSPDKDVDEGTRGGGV